MNLLKSIRRTPFGLVALLTLFLAPCASADDGTQKLIEITPETDLSSITCQNASLSLETDDKASVLCLKLEANTTGSRMTIKPPGDVWNLSAAKGVEAVVTNKSDAPVSFTLQVENAFTEGTEPYSKAAITLNPGATATVQAPFGKVFGHAGSYQFDPKAVTGVTIYVAGPAVPAERKLLIRSIESFITEQD
jgi:hypothetical protein